MHRYAKADFLGYYTGAWILHPHTGDVVQVIGNGQGSCINLSDKSSIPLEELDWKHVQTPKLGFRSINNGAHLFYIERHAGRRREKGVIPPAIVVSVPSEILGVYDVLGVRQEVLHNAQLNSQVAKQIFAPSFMRLSDAVKRLIDEPSSVGFALSHNWAVCLGQHKEAPFIIMFKNERVAYSKDGVKWVWDNKDAAALFNEELS